eukprot:TRINITY_DN12071_c1_g1_i1.p1 TRINITY_DN12071_c1_g1~~TRINITY_DN12071_c1_g1_i1.p1  ORF type:complete len:424 (+),score=68.15 TRINITY_DN12071_c1_g1_i1:151-1422(+)
MAGYDILVEDGGVSPDEKQKAALRKFQRLHNNLVKFSKQSSSTPQQQGFLSNLFGGKSKSETKSSNLSDIKGLYVCGGVGCGKSFLMDLFYDKVPIKKKRRVHFNSFMLDIHLRIHEIKKTDISADAIKTAADQISSEVDLLCFDEFQITDIGDAMIVRRLFSAMYENGLVMVATSNRKPEELYEGGLNRHIFIPFIKLLKDKCTTHTMESSTDYRKEGVPIEGAVFMTPLSMSSTKKLESTIEKLTGGETLKPASVRVFGRDVPVRGAAKGVASFTFDDLCTKPMSTADFGAIAKEFHTIALSGIPAMTITERTEARRFIYLIDELYENKCNIICTASVLPDGLFSGSGLEGLTGVDLEAADALGVRNADAMSMFTGSDEVFAFGRAVSRLNEMQTREYLLTPHSKLGVPASVKAWVDELEA